MSINYTQLLKDAFLLQAQKAEVFNIFQSYVHFVFSDVFFTITDESRHETIGDEIDGSIDKMGYLPPIKDEDLKKVFISFCSYHIVTCMKGFGSEWGIKIFGGYLNKKMPELFKAAFDKAFIAYYGLYLGNTHCNDQYPDIKEEQSEIIKIIGLYKNDQDISRKLFDQATKNGVFGYCKEIIENFKIIFPKIGIKPNSSPGCDKLYELMFSNQNTRDFSRYFPQDMKNSTFIGYPHQQMLKLNLGNVEKNKKCSKGHIAFQSCDTHEFLPSDVASRCYICEKGLSGVIQDDYCYQEYDYDNKSLLFQIGIEDGIDGLNPLSLQIFRIIWLIVSKNKDETQVDGCLVAISKLLFPYTSFQVTKYRVMEFVSKTLDCVKSYINKAGVEYNLMPLSRFFGFFISLSVPTVWQNTSKKLNPQFFSLPNFLSLFLVNPQYQKDCPVIYSYVKNGVFLGNDKHIYNVYRGLVYIWEHYKDEPNEFIDFEESNNVTKEAFLNSWAVAAKQIINGYISTELRDQLCETIFEEDEQEEAQIRANLFLPNMHEKWLGLYVLNELSKYHNDFVNTLAKLTNIIVEPIRAEDLTKSQDDNHLINNFAISAYFMASLYGSIFQSYNKHSNDIDFDSIVFNDSIETSFIKSLMNVKFYYLTFPLFGQEIYESSDIIPNCSSIVRVFGLLYAPFPLNKDQKQQIYEFIVYPGKVAETLSFLEKIMHFAISKPQRITNNMEIDQVIEAFNTIEDPSNPQKSKPETRPIIETYSSRSLLAASSNCSDPMRINQISGIYKFLKMASSNTIVSPKSLPAEQIFSHVSRNFNIDEVEIDVNCAENERSIIHQLCIKLNIELKQERHSSIKNLVEKMLTTNSADLTNDEKDILQAIKNGNSNHPLIKKFSSDDNPALIPLLYHKLSKQMIE